MVAYRRWSLTGGGRLQEVVAYRRWLLMGGGHLQEVSLIAISLAEEPSESTDGGTSRDFS